MKIYVVAFLAAASSALAKPQRVRKGHAGRTESLVSSRRILQKDQGPPKEELSLSMSFPDMPPPTIPATTTVPPLATEAPGKNDVTDDGMSMPTPPAEATEAPAGQDVMSMPPAKEDLTDDEMSMPSASVETTEAPGKEDQTDDEMSMPEPPVETTEAPGKEDQTDDEMSMPAPPVETTEAPGKEDQTDDEMSMPAPPVETTEAPGKEDQTDDEMSMPSLPVATTEAPLTTETTVSTTIGIESLPADIPLMSMPDEGESDNSWDVDTTMSVGITTEGETPASPGDGLVDDEGPSGDDKFSAAPQEPDSVVSNIEKSSSVIFGSNVAAIAITGAMMFI